jgi:hypothetical protein
MHNLWEVFDRLKEHNLKFTMTNHIHRNHIILQLKPQKNSYTIIMQLSIWYYN